MLSPFPGIDPYLEGQHFWEDFHPSFLTYCRDALNEILPGDYVAQLGERIRLVELSHRAAKSVRPDIAVIAASQNRSRKTIHERKAAGRLTLEPVTIPLPTVETELSDVWIEVRRGTARTPVTIIELLSPTNKTGDGFVEYKLNGRSSICQKIHLVELDLLLAGRRLPMSLPLPSGDYFAFVSRPQCRPDTEVYAWTIHDRLPSIPIPLPAGTADVTLDLSGVFATTYDRGQYSCVIDYRTAPSVLRKTEDRAWAEKRARRGRR